MDHTNFLTFMETHFTCYHCNISFHNKCAVTHFGHDYCANCYFNVSDIEHHKTKYGGLSKNVKYF